MGNQEVSKTIEVPKRKVPERWLDKKETGEQIDAHLSGLSKRFMKYRLNVFLLNRFALKLQHWFFYKRFNKTSSKQGAKSAEEKPSISTEKYKKLNGTSRIPKAAEKHL